MASKKKKRSFVKTVRISRKHWCRGGNGGTALRTKTGQSCCLGFLVRAFGLRTPTGCPGPADLLSSEFGSQDCTVLPEAFQPIGSRGQFGAIESPLCVKLINTNDSCLVKGAERERMIKDLMAEGGVRVVFED